MASKVAQIMSQSKPSKTIEAALSVCIRHVAHDWQEAPSPRSWAALGAASQTLVFQECHSPHLRAVHSAAAGFQLDELCLEPAVIAAVVEHPPCGAAAASGAQLRRRREGAAIATGGKAASGPQLLAAALDGVAPGKPMVALNLRRIISDGGRGVLRALLEAGLPVDSMDSRGISLLALACQGAQIGTVQLLLDRGATLHRLPLVLAAKEGHNDIVCLLLEAAALHSCRCKGYPDGDQLLDKCFAPEERVRISSIDAALCYASRAGNLSTVQLLASRGANVNLRNEKRSPLVHAAMAGYADVVRLLIELQADPNAIMPDGSTALLHAAQWGHVTSARALLDGGARTAFWMCPIQDVKNAGAPPTPSHTPLMLAAKEGHLEMAKLLLERGADSSAQNSVGRTALQLAATMQREAIVRLLIDEGANINTVDAEGRTAADCARSGSCYDLIVGRGAACVRALQDTSQLTATVAVDASLVEAVSVPDCKTPQPPSKLADSEFAAAVGRKRRFSSFDGDDYADDVFLSDDDFGEEEYEVNDSDASILSSILELGFDHAAALEALAMAGGNRQDALEQLLMHAACKRSRIA